MAGRNPVFKTTPKLPHQKVHMAALDGTNRIVPLCSPDTNYTVSEDPKKVNCTLCGIKAKQYGR